MKKLFNGIMAFLLTTVLLATNIQANTRTVSIKAKPVGETVISGDRANFIFEVKATGAVNTHKDVDLVISVPEKSNLITNTSDLKIFGVEPRLEGGKLFYHFDELENGKTQRVLLEFETENGYCFNGDDILVEGVLSSKGEVLDEADAAITVVSDAGISVSKIYNGAEGKNKVDAPVSGDVISWKLRVSSEKKEKGQMFIKEGSKIVIKDELPNGVTYLDDTLGGEYDEESHSITWYIDAPSYEDQESAVDNLFVQDIEVRTEINDFGTTNYNYELWNKGLAEATVINDTVIKNETWAKVDTIDDEGFVPVMDGNYYHGNHYGPADGSGLPSYPEANPNPTVYDTAKLGFGTQYYINPGAGITIYLNGEHRGYQMEYWMYEEIVQNGYKELNIDYTVDEKLLLEDMFFSLPQDNYAVSSKPTSLKKMPKAILEFKMRDGSVEYFELDYNSFEDKKARLTIEDMGLSSNDVSGIRYSFVPAEGEDVVDGKIGAPYLFDATFSIKEGATGEVMNNTSTSYVTGSGYQFDIVPYADWANNGPRHANIAPKPEGTLPTGIAHIQLDKDVEGIVRGGDNTLSASFRNDAGSLEDIFGPYEMFVKVPANVVIDESSLTSDHDSHIESKIKLKDGSVVMKVVVGDKNTILAPGEDISFSFDVDVLEEGSSSLALDIYAQPGNKEIKTPTYGESSVTDTVVTTQDDIDILKELITSNDVENIIKSSNLYHLIRTEELISKKLVKGSLDSEFSSMGKTEFDSISEYKLVVGHTYGDAINDLTIVDTLPNVGDKGITDGVNRESAYGVSLLGALKIEGDQSDKLVIRYSEEQDVTFANIDEVKWLSQSEVSNWGDINSFKITLAKGQVWTAENNEIEITYKVINEPGALEEDFNLDKTVEERTAWNSFAVKVEDLDEVEPLRVGLVMEHTEELQIPEISKKVNDKVEDVIDIIDEINYEIKVNLPDSLSGYKDFEITDQLDERLSINNVSVNTDKGTEFDYKIEELNNKLSIKVERDVLEALDGSIIVSINAELKNKEMFDKIDNKAQVVVNNDHKVNSNNTSITPVQPKDPNISKLVNDEESIVVKQGEEFNFAIDVSLPENKEGYDYIEIVDEVDSRLKVNEVEVSVGEAVVEGNKISLKLNREEIETIDNVLLEIKSAFVSDQDFDAVFNTASIKVNGNNEIESNEVEVKQSFPAFPLEPIVPEYPTVNKLVNDKEYDKVDSLNGHLYELFVQMPSSFNTYSSLEVLDKLDERVSVKFVNVVVDGNDLSSDKFSYDISDKNEFSLIIERDNLNGLENKELVVELTFDINDDSDHVLVDNVFSVVANASEKKEIESNKVVVEYDKPIPAIPIEPIVPEYPTVNKLVNDKEYDKVDSLNGHLYELFVQMPSSFNTYSSLEVLDKLDERIDVKSVNVLIDGELLSEDLYELEVNELNELSLVIDRENLNGLEDKELNIQILFDIEDDSDHVLVDNVFSVVANASEKKEIESNKVVVEYDKPIPAIPIEPIVPEYPVIDKVVDGELEVVSVDFKHKYSLNVNMPSSFNTYKGMTIKDNLDERLSIESVKLMIEGQELDESLYSLSIIGNEVTISISRENLNGLEDKKLVIEIEVFVNSEESFEIHNDFIVISETFEEKEIVSNDTVITYEKPVEPTEPEEKPTEPEEKPTEPEEKPTEPEEKPTEPEEKPTEPEEKPTEPEEKPTEPEEKPTEPEEKPTEPEEKPTEPEEKPSEPEEKPTEPEEKPSEPEEKPTEPEEKPTEPEEKPEVPEENPVISEDVEVEEVESVSSSNTNASKHDAEVIQTGDTTLVRAPLVALAASAAIYVVLKTLKKKED